MIRKANIADRNEIFELVLDKIKDHPFKADKERIQEMITHALHRHNFCYVSEDEGHIKGLAVAFSRDNSLFVKKSLSIEAFFTPIKGDGDKLLRKLRQFFTPRPALKFISMVFDCNIDDRCENLLINMGFEKRGGSWLYRRPKNVIL